MRIGIDASRAFTHQRTGTENYSLKLINALIRLDKKNDYTLYVKDTPLRRGLSLPKNFQYKVISLAYLWTQAGLALECLVNPPDVLFIPAHTMPILRHPSLKTVVTIHDLGSEYLPQHHKFPQKIYLNWSTIYAVRHATRLIAVSKNTKKDLIIKLGCSPEKISVIYESYS